MYATWPAWHVFCLCRPFADQSLGRFPATAVSPERYFHSAFYGLETKEFPPPRPIAASSPEEHFSRASSLVGANNLSAARPACRPRPPACIQSLES